MTSTPRSLWLEPGRRVRLRLVLALLAAPMLLAALLTGLVFLAAGSTMATREGTMAVTAEAASVFFLVLPGFSLSFGLAGVAVLWFFGLRGVLAWAAAGLAAGAVGPVALALAAGGSPVVKESVIAAGLGVAILLLTRWLGGIRSG